jgi:DNA-binding transcriptional regulator YiaG
MGKQTPAQIVRKMFGTRALARALKISRDAVLKWDRTGRVPSKYQETLLELARQQRKALTADMLISGA